MHLSYHYNYAKKGRRLLGEKEKKNYQPQQTHRNKRRRDLEREITKQNRTSIFGLGEGVSFPCFPNQ